MPSGTTQLCPRANQTTVTLITQKHRWTPTKQNLFQTKTSCPQFSKKIWRKVSSLGSPFELRQEEKSSSGSTKSPPASLRYVICRTAAPFLTAAIADNGLPLSFPPDDDQDKELGLANRAPPKEPPCPYIPLVSLLRKTIEDLQSSRNVPRLPWHTTNFQAPPEVESEFFSPAEVPHACWQQMKDGEYTCRSKGCSKRPVQTADSQTTYDFPVE